MSPMPFAELPDVVQDRFRERSHVNTNFYRAISHHPELTSTWMEFAFGIRDNCRTRRSLLELMILRSAMLNQVRYTWHHHRAMAATAGVTDNQVAELGVWRDSVAFSADERAALDLIDSVVTGDGIETARERLESEFDKAEQVELMMTASFYSAVARMLKMLDVPLERGD